MGNETVLIEGYRHKVIAKVWGQEKIIVNGDNGELYCMKELRLGRGRASSKHFHEKKDETFYVLRGNCFLEVGENLYSLCDHMSIHLPPGTVHRFWKPWSDDSDCLIMEVSTHHDDADVVRYEESMVLGPGETPRSCFNTVRSSTNENP